MGITILLAEDQSKVRSAVRLLLEQQQEVSIVEESSTLPDMMNIVRNHCFDVLLLDWKLVGISPEKTLKTIRSFCPGIPIIAMDSNPQIRYAAIQAGASNFVSKNDTPEELLAVIINSGDDQEKIVLKSRRK